MAVDDEPVWLRLYEDAFAQTGHTIRAMTDGSAVLGEIARRKPDVVILDIRMAPSGRDMLRRVHKAHPELPVVIATAYSGYRTDPDFERAAGFVVKSGDPTDLLAKVEEILAARTVQMEADFGTEGGDSGAEKRLRGG
jgi:DNA-binding NtrC family response regulator